MKTQKYNIKHNYNMNGENVTRTENVKKKSKK